MKKFVVVILLCIGSLLAFNLIRADEYLDVNGIYKYGENQHDNYTSSDEFSYQFENEISEKYKIDEYAKKLWKKTISIANHEKTILGGTIVFDYAELKIIGDDPIVKIIPREFFIFRGEYFYIGNEYAFYVKTEEMTEYSNRIQVFIIDIISEYDNVNITSHMIKPIFQANFWYLSKKDNYDNKYSNSELKVHIDENIKTVIIPEIRFDSKMVVNRQTTDLYVKNMGIEIALENEQHLNQKDQNYVGMDSEKNIIDKGSFITRTDVNYLGYGNKDYSDTINLIVSLITNVAGFNSNKNSRSILGGGLLAISLIGTLYSTIQELITFIEQGAHNFRTTREKDDELEFGEDVDFVTARDQLEKKGILNKAGLVSTFQDDISSSLLLGNNRNALNKEVVDYLKRLLQYQKQKTDQLD